MSQTGQPRTNRSPGKSAKYLVWGLLTAAVIIPIAASAMSPLLAWRGPAYIAAGFAGVVAMTLLLVQPLLVGGYLPGLSGRRGRRVHGLVGSLLVLAVVVHVAGLWITSAPDVVDALLFLSPTPFSAYGVIAMGTVFAAALLALFKRKLGKWGVKPQQWRLFHTGFVAVTVIGSVVHALLIEGTMETISKAALCILVVAATVKLILDLRLWVAQSRK